MGYSQIIILGGVQLSYQIAVFLQRFNLPIKLYDTNAEGSQFLKELCHSHDVDYKHLQHDKLSCKLSSISKSTLIISALNPYIIPRYVLEKENIKAINYHPALLPRHPGRNVEAWTIYEMDEATGITWHFINAEIDAGHIIEQREIPLHNRYTSLSLLRDLNRLAFKSLSHFIGDLMREKISGYPQEMSLRTRLHYSWEVPNDGFLSLLWNGPKVSAFLRAMDYGILNVFSKPKLLIEEMTFQWRKYQIIDNLDDDRLDEVVINKDRIEIYKGNYKIILFDHYSITK